MKQTVISLITVCLFTLITITSADAKKAESTAPPPDAAIADQAVDTPPGEETEPVDEVYIDGHLIDINSERDRGIIDLGTRDGLKGGEKLVVVRTNGKSIDPISGKEIGVGQSVVGEIEVLAVSTASSNVEIVKGNNKVAMQDGIRLHTSRPKGASIIPVGFRKLEISWFLQAEEETDGYNIYRSDAADGIYEKIGFVDGRNHTRYPDEYSKDNQLSDSTTYFYRISTINRYKVESALAAPVQGTTLGPPDPPVEFRASNGKVRSVFLAWGRHNNKEVAGYRIYRARAAEGPFKMIVDIKGNEELTYDDLNGGSKTSPRLDDAATYYYLISAYSPYNDEGTKSEVIEAGTADKPSPPADFEVVGWQARQVTINWTPNTDDNVRGYLIYRALDESGPYEMIVDIKDRKKRTYMDRGKSKGWFSSTRGAGNLEDFSTYYYRIQSYNWAKSRSQMSETISATTKAGPLPVEELRVDNSNAGLVQLSWRKSPEVDIKEYRIFVSDEEMGKYKKLAVVPADQTLYVYKKSKPGGIYYFRVMAVDTFGLEGEFSKTIKVTVY